MSCQPEDRTEGIRTGCNLHDNIQVVMSQNHCSIPHSSLPSCPLAVSLIPKLP